MKRIPVMLCIVISVLAVNLSGANVANSAVQVPPTNTKRPTIAPLPATNTPKATLPPAATNAPTDKPKPTLVPTRTKVPTKTATPTRTPIPTKTHTLTPTITPTTIGPVSYPENINTLTGLPYPNDAAKNRRNIIVKVSNYPWIVRPQGGLGKADVVYEYEVEGAVTRFAAIYRSQAGEHVGSVRSGRLPDLELVPMYQALLAYSGSNDNIKKMILDGTCIDNEQGGSRVLCSPDKPNLIESTNWKYQAITPQFGDNCPPFCRFPRPGLPFEHTLFANTNQIWEIASKRNVNTPIPARGFAFDENIPTGGKAANDIFIKWYGDQDARWQYNPTDGKYYRWNTGLPHIDADTGQQLTADNIIVIEAFHKKRNDVYESEEGSPAIEIQLWGQQKAWVFRDGKWYEGIWMRRNRERGALMLTTDDGKRPLFLKPGNSWVEVVRCCDMNGVDVSESLIDVQGTSVYAAETATKRAPNYPVSALTQTAAFASGTQTASAATAGVSLTTPNPDSNAPTATPNVVGMNIP